MASPSVSRASIHGSVSESRRTSIETSPRPSRVAKERKCQYCEKTFFKTEHLLRHERGHTKERPFQCKTCGRVYGRQYGNPEDTSESTTDFRLSDTLLRHAKGHTDEEKRSKSASHSSLRLNVTPNSHSNSTAGSQNMASVSPPNQQPSAKEAADGGDVGQVDGDFQQATNLGFGGMVPIQEQPELNATSLHDALAQGAGEQSQYFTGNFPTASFHGSDTSPFSDTNFWGASWMSPGPSWLVGFDFDLNALNTSVLATMDMEQPPLLFPSTQHTHSVHSEHQQPTTTPHVEIQKKQRFMDDVMKRSWFTRVRDVDSDDEFGKYTSGRNTPAITTERYDVDDSFRERVSLKLKPKPNNHPLPPANFLSLSVQVYFSKFNALFPILHSHTFRPNPKNSLLLLSVCSIGSLLIGSKGAAAQGARIFETLNKAILASVSTSGLHSIYGRDF